jgi:hypothetical protein
MQCHLGCGLGGDADPGGCGAPMRSRRSDNDKPPPTNMITAPSNRVSSPISFPVSDD